jgi:hypothetical protein
MKVVDLPGEQESLYCQCLEEWSPEMKEAGDTRSQWHLRMKERGLRVRLCLDDSDTVGGMAAWGASIPVFMRASWFRRQGYRVADSSGMMKLLWKPFVDDAVPPKWPKQHRKPDLQPGRVVKTALVNGRCPGQNLACQRAKRVAAELSGRVVFQEIDTFDRHVGLEWGASDGLFVDCRTVRTGPPPSRGKIRALVHRESARLKHTPAD